MPTITSTRASLIQRISASLDDLLPRSGQGTATGGSTTTLTVAGEIGALPAGSLIGAEIYTVAGTGLGQYLRITQHTVASGTATLTFPAATAVDSTTTFEIHRLGGKGFSRKNYEDAINAACDTLADYAYTDLSGVYFGIERGSGGVGGSSGGGVTIGGLYRSDYPMPSGYNYLWGLDVLRGSALQCHPVTLLNAFRAMGDAAARTRLGQGFQIQQQALVSYMGLWCGKVGSPTDDTSIVVETNSAGLPSGTAVTNGTSALVGGAAFSTRLGWKIYTFSPPMLLAKDTTYQLTWKRSGATSGTNYYLAGEDDGNNYSLGALALYGGATWTAVAGSDLLFSVWPQSDWAKLAADDWEYKPQNTDQLTIKHLSYYSMPEGVPVQLRGGAAIARPTDETTAIAIDPGYAEQFAVLWLNGRHGDAQKLAGAAATGGLIPSAKRSFPANSVKIWA